MKMFKKLYLTLSGSMHTVVDRLQNHEALAVASLSELEDRIHAARVATASLARGLKSTEEETASTEREAVQWRTRARHQGESGDRETALQCLHRARTLDQRAHALHRQRTTSQAAHERLQQTLSEMQSTHATLSLRLKELRLRQSCQAFDDPIFSGAATDPMATLDRWEDTLGGTHEFTPFDPLKEECEQREHRVQLEAELSELLSTKSA